MAICDAKYLMPDPNVAVNTVTDVVSGRYLAHTHASPIERAFMAADLYLGTRELVLPTMTQAAFLARVNTTYAWWALKRLPERAAIQAGQLPLVPSRPKTNGRALALAPEIVDSVLINIVRAVGTERMLAAACAVEAAE